MQPPRLFRLLLCSILVCLFIHPSRSEDSNRPRVLAITDICLQCGNANDTHSLVHLLWHADEIDLVGIHSNEVDRLQGSTGFEAIHRVLNAYEEDYRDPQTTFSDKPFPDPERLRGLVPATFEESIARIHEEARRSDAGPLYILNWSNLRTIRAALERDPGILENIRLITVSTRTHYDNCREPNLNGWGRDQVFRDPRFKKLWWIEMDWTPPAFVKGEESAHLLNVLGRLGKLGGLLHEEAGEDHRGWGFQGSDSVSLLYLLDPTHSADNPAEPGWAGRYTQPFPQDRPAYYTDDMGPYEWDFEKPCRTWIDRKLALEHCQSHLSNRRDEVFAALLAKGNAIYPAQARARSMASYEAENARLSPDLEVKSDLTASHGFYVEMKGSGKIVWEIHDVPSEGDYLLRIRYRIPYLHKTQRLRVNGEDRGSIKFDGHSRVWQEKEIIQTLKEGDNEIVIEKDWGYVDFDSISLTTEAT